MRKRNTGAVSRPSAIGGWRGGVFAWRATLAWSAVAIGWSIVIAGAASAGFNLSATTVRTARWSRLTAHSPTLWAAAEPICRNYNEEARHAGDDGVLPGRHHKAGKKRDRRHNAAVPGGYHGPAVPASDIAADAALAAVDSPKAARDHARAPPTSNQHA